MLIRPAIPLDARAIAEIHVASWRETYVGIIPAEILDRLSVDHREQSWAKFLAEITHQSNYIFVAEANGSMVGFVSGGAHRLEESTKGGVSKEQVGAFGGELTAIYLLRSHQKMGIGRSLFNVAKEKLREAGFGSMLIWVLKDNPATKFYEKMGGNVVAKKKVEIGISLDEVAYGFDL